MEDSFKMTTTGWIDVGLIPMHRRVLVFEGVAKFSPSYKLFIVQHNMSSTAGSTSRYSMRGLFDTFKLDCKAAALEFVGTTMFLLLGLGGIQVAADEAGVSGTTIEHVMYIATSMGLSLLVSAWLFYRITGGLFNPNITLALFLVGLVNPMRFVLFCIAQLVGAIAASALLFALTPGPLYVK